ncbi:MAG: Collagen triple helix repeat [Paenibacillaceae bacterium]|nr:Collagen triple helix repeat [Paenibacillaceae bacterium]
MAITGSFLYVANNGDSMIEVFDILDSVNPVRLIQFNGTHLNSPFGLAIKP